ncbi:hypothetical protein Rmf_08610 [Roseomonas fluvialis]|uniref:Uncharacterized protein n=1 Tax=Roseomonas fluvialis TaxID=1750527 RepID=A0ABM7XZJ5_9PROT|nr:hypothetical protein Rmf_08610 [Roseomonas fluvialis]
MPRPVREVAQGGQDADSAAGQAHDPSGETIARIGWLHAPTIRCWPDEANSEAMVAGQRARNLLGDSFRKPPQFEAAAFGLEAVNGNHRRVTPAR